MSREIDWRERLPYSIKVKGRRALIKTRLEAAEYFLTLPAGRQNRTTWQAAARALNGGAPIDTVWNLVSKAVASDGDGG